MNILKIISVLLISVIAAIGIMLVLNVIDSEEARDTAIKFIAVFAIIGGASGLIDIVRK